MISQRKAVALLLITTLALSPLIEAMAQERLLQETEPGKVIVLSEKVGETIDLKERDYYGLFLSSKNFQSAVILQRPDSSFVVQITEENDGIKQLITQPIERKILDVLRQYIDNFENLSSVDKARLLGLEDEASRAATKNARIEETREQAQKLARENWTKERWREEVLNDRGRSYRTSGGMLGFTLGAAAGMLIGKGFQGKKVVRQQFHEGEWGVDPWTEDFYSYERKQAPHWGAALGGTVGALSGYLLGKKADKKYYLLVPKSIRTERTKSSWLGHGAFGFLVWGPLVGGITGWALYTPMSGKHGKTSLGGGETIGGYLTGAIMGVMIISGYGGRAKRKQLWQESFTEQTPEPSLELEFIPLDPAAFSIYSSKLPHGDTFYVYQMDLLRVRF